MSDAIWSEAIANAAGAGAVLVPVNGGLAIEQGRIALSDFSAMQTAAKAKGAVIIANNGVQPIPAPQIAQPVAAPAPAPAPKIRTRTKAQPVAPVIATSDDANMVRMITALISAGVSPENAARAVAGMHTTPQAASPVASAAPSYQGIPQPMLPAMFHGRANRNGSPVDIVPTGVYLNGKASYDAKDTLYPDGSAVTGWRIADPDLVARFERTRFGQPKAVWWLYNDTPGNGADGQTFVRTFKTKTVVNDVQTWVKIDSRDKLLEIQKRDMLAAQSV